MHHIRSRSRTSSSREPLHRPPLHRVVRTSSESQIWFEMMARTATFARSQKNRTEAFIHFRGDWVIRLRLDNLQWCHRCARGFHNGNYDILGLCVRDILLEFVKSRNNDKSLVPTIPLVRIDSIDSHLLPRFRSSC